MATTRSRIFLLILWALCLAALFGACGSGDQTLLQADPDAVPQDPDFQLVNNIMQRSCAPCHKSGEGVSARHDGIAALDGGEDLDLSTCAGIRDNAEDILLSTIGRNDMPPGAWPRLTSEEKLILERWVDNGKKVPTPCN